MQILWAWIQQVRTDGDNTARGTARALEDEINSFVVDTEVSMNSKVDLFFIYVIDLYYFHLFS